MEHERGLSPATIEIRRRYGECFLRWFEERQRPFSSICLTDVDQYLAAGWARQCVLRNMLSVIENVVF